MSELPVAYQIVIWAIPVIFAITLHEVGHGWAAKLLGDTTAKDMGRLTLNPIKHIDPVGSIVVPFLMFFVGGFIFGWAKPVPVNWNRLKNKKRDMALVALAGPVANLLMIIVWLVLAKLFIASAEQGSMASSLIILAALIGLMINALIMLLNLIPIPPLDGSRVVFSLLPDKLAYKYARIEPYGIIIIVVLLVIFVKTEKIGLFISWLEKFMYSLIV